ncbi:hypothetical protein NSS98_30795 [Paenibacillus sp. FSL E2-0274]|uniref:hypothetical protein n=1 Tax=Paenibacillus TaxID=44249 RepID=UPI00096D5670|nr:hypothetical protein [Paenibacillus odorifer]OMD12608.1 hypothetical protein BJP47_05150 [Paenibacillus odorifer]OME36244.1 hypothetical protein BSK63_03845 [Paenibacillus odorifer]
MTTDPYPSLVEQEDLLSQRIDTCLETIDAVLQMLYQKDHPIHLPTAQSIIAAMHEVQVKIERELLLLRTEKRLAARQMDNKPS